MFFNKNFQNVVQGLCVCKQNREPAFRGIGGLGEKRPILHFLKHAEIVCSFDIYQLLSSPPFQQHAYNNALNVIRDLCFCKQTVYKIFESAIFSFFGQASSRCCSWSSAPEF